MSWDGGYVATVDHRKRRLSELAFLGAQPHADTLELQPALNLTAKAGASYAVVGWNGKDARTTRRLGQGRRRTTTMLHRTGWRRSSITISSKDDNGAPDGCRLPTVTGIEVLTDSCSRPRESVDCSGRDYGGSRVAAGNPAEDCEGPLDAWHPSPRDVRPAGRQARSGHCGRRNARRPASAARPGAMKAARNLGAAPRRNLVWTGEKTNG